MAFSALAIALIIGLTIIILVQQVQYNWLEKRSFEIKDQYLSLVIGKKLVEPKDYLYKTEKDFFGLLRDIYGNKYNIATQVHLSDLAEVISGYRDHDNLYFELKRIIYDFVIFDKEFRPLVAIELNGSSHNAKNRKVRDLRADNFASNLKIPMVIFGNEDRFDRVKVETVLKKYLSS
jgi:hypothetical protein